MTTTRFARSGRVRICILMSMFVVVIMMIVIYHMSQHQLDQSRAFQEGLSVQMQSLTAEKLTVEKKVNALRSEKLNLQKNFENQLAEASQKQQETEHALQEKYEAEVNKYKLLEVKFNDLKAECVKSKKKHIDDTNAFEQQLQSLLSELHKDKSAKELEVNMWKEKHDKLQRDSVHKIHALEFTLTEYKANCHYVPRVQPAEAPSQQQQLNKPGDLLSPTTTSHSRTAQLAHSIEKPHNEKIKSNSFNAQVQVSQGLYRIGGGVNVPATNLTPTNPATNDQNLGGGDGVQKKEQLPPLAFAVRNNHSLILNSVENFQIAPKPLNEKMQQEEPQLAAAAGGGVSPLSAPRKSSTASSAGAAARAVNNAPNASVAPKLSSSSGLPPLALPPAKHDRKLPENVAPIPDNFDAKGGEAVDVDTAAEELPKNEANNRYANVVNDLESNKANLGVAPKPNEDSGAHEVKDALNEPNFNLPAAAAEQHFFDNEVPAPAAAGAVADDPAGKPLGGGAEGEAAGAGGVGEDDDDVGDVAVKQPQHLLEGENLNNEIVGDQGKEFAEGLHLDDGMEEDQDEDDYSNVAARKQGAEAIRN